eukprot:277460-Amorphochlora_amoeboformis.AAC.1
MLDPTKGPGEIWNYRGAPGFAARPKRTATTTSVTVPDAPATATNSAVSNAARVNPPGVPAVNAAQETVSAPGAPAVAVPPAPAAPAVATVATPAAPATSTVSAPAAPYSNVGLDSILGSSKPGQSNVIGNIYGIQ